MNHKPASSDNHITVQQLNFLIDFLKTHGATLAGKKVTAGFDGFIDTIANIIKTKSEAGPTLFTQIEEFGNYIIGKGGTSFSLELEERSIKIGGNMPIMANALGHLGVPVNCVGAFGLPKSHPVFQDLSPNCRLFSFADPGTSTALEFADGKIMLGNMGSLNTFGWDKIRNIIGIENLISLYKGIDASSIVNWSEIDASTDIWKGLLTDILPHANLTGKKPFAFFDLSDCSKRTNDSILEALELLKEFQKYSSVALSLNTNEAQWIYRVLHLGEAGNDLNDAGQKIFNMLGLDTVIIHSRTESMAFNRNETKQSNSFFTSSPKISTGAGDHFNAGFCTAHLLGLDLRSSLIFANAVSGYYVRSGTSPSLASILNFLEEIKKELN